MTISRVGGHRRCIPIPAAINGRILILLIGLTLAAAIAPSTGLAAETVTCGQTPPGATKSAKATLTLDTEQSKTTLNFGKGTKTGHLSLIFKASGCDLPDAPPDPSLKPVALKGEDDIPDETLKVQDTTVDTDHNLLILRVQALPKTFSPGTHRSLVFAKANYLATNATTITLSRSEHDWWWLVLIGLGVAAAGLGLTVAISFASNKLELSGIRLAIVAVLMLGSGLYAAISNWWTQDVWTFDSNLKGLVIATFVAASTGTLAGLIGGGSRER